MKTSTFLKIAVFLALVFLFVFKVTFNQPNEFHVEKYRFTSDQSDGDSILRAISAAKNHGGGTVILGNKAYNTKFKNYSLPSNITLKGSGTNSEIASTINGTLFKASNKKNIKIEDIKFHGPDNKSLLIQVDRIKGLQISDCVFENIRMFKSHLPPGVSYSTMKESLLTKNIKLSNNKGIGAKKTINGAFIEVAYVKNVEIRSNSIRRYQHGIQWWGGDANPDRNGLLDNPRWAINIQISKNIIDNIGMGGIWGSMGNKVMVVDGNKVTNCGDVGIDFEGTFASSATGNYVKNCRNGCITTFFLNRDILINRNIIESDVKYQYLFRIYNSHNKDNQSITFTDNHLTHKGSSIGYVGGEQIDKLLISRNKLTDVAILFDAINYREIKIDNNQLLFNNAHSQLFSAIYAKGFVQNGEVFVERNKIKSNIPQPLNSRGLYIILDDFNTATKANANGNKIEGFTIDVEMRSDSKNKGIVHFFVVENNMMASRNFIFTQGDSLIKSNLSIKGNYDKENITYNPIIQ